MAQRLLNFAAVFHLLVVFFVQNNKYAISVPLAHQSVAPSLAHKAVGYGMAGERVDGNDMVALLAVLDRAVKLAREGSGPLLVIMRRDVEAVILSNRPLTSQARPGNPAVVGPGSPTEAPSPEQTTFGEGTAACVHRPFVSAGLKRFPDLNTRLETAADGSQEIVGFAALIWLRGADGPGPDGPLDT